MTASPSPLLIRPARADDVPAIIRADTAASALFAPTGLLSEEALADHVLEEDLLASIRAGETDVADLNGEGVVGFSQFTKMGDDLYLQQISVHPGFGKHGIGRKLMDALDTHAEKSRAKQITLSTFRDLAWNAPFYASLGFTELPRSAYAPYMTAIETSQAPFMDISKRVFMRKSVRKSTMRAK